MSILMSSSRETLFRLYVSDFHHFFSEQNLSSQIVGRTRLRDYRYLIINKQMMDRAAEDETEKTISGGSRSWSKFAQDTTMHGIRYVNVSDSPVITRLVQSYNSQIISLCPTLRPSHLCRITHQTSRCSRESKAMDIHIKKKSTILGVSGQRCEC